MIVKQLQNRTERKIFYTFPHSVYARNPYYRATEETLTRLLVDGPTAFHSHATVSPCLLWESGEIVGRCALVHDLKMPQYIQVAFFEAVPGLYNVSEALLHAARNMGVGAKKLLVGLNGHLNYGAGILLDRFDEPPVFGLPYNPRYYTEYFNGMFCRECISFRFPLNGIYDWARRVNDTFDPHGISVRFLRKHELRKEIDLYTYIDNTTFSNTEYWYWSNRDPRENYELFHPFRFLMMEEHLLFAEKDGKPVGFLLWYPDFNGLVHPGHDIGLLDVVRYHAANPLRTVRLAEVAVMPEYRKTPAVAAMLIKSLPRLEKAGYEICEGGFIFRENRGSVLMTQRYIERGLGYKMEPHRTYGMFEADL